MKKAKLNLAAFKAKLTKEDTQAAQHLTGDILGTCHDADTTGHKGEVTLRKQYADEV